MSENKTTGTSTASGNDSDEDLSKGTSQRQDNQGDSGGNRWVIATIPLVVSVASLLISGVNFFFVLRTPQVDLEMPPFISVAQPKFDDGSAIVSFLVQPHFFYPGTSQRAEVVTNMRLFVDPEGDAGPIECIWMEQGVFAGRNFALTNRSNPSPIVVDPSTVQTPVARFEPIFEKWSDWQLKPGHYKLTLRAERAVAREPLEATMNITVLDAHMPQIEDQFSIVWDDTARKPTPPTEMPESEF